MGDSFDDMEYYSGLIPDSDEEFETDLDELDYDELLVLAEDLKSKLEKAKDALEEIAIEQKFFIKSKDYFSEVVRLNLTAKETLKEIEGLEWNNYILSLLLSHYDT